MKTKLNPSVFKAAAKLIHYRSQSCCCWALEDLAYDSYRGYNRAIPYIDFLDEHFNPHNGYCFWWGRGTPNQQEARVLALLFCAEMIKNP
jgi:hypothetical protein